MVNGKKQMRMKKYYMNMKYIERIYNDINNES